MIRPLRQVHRRVLITLGIVLPMAFVAGMAERQVFPAMDALPARLAMPQNFPALVWERTDFFVQLPVRVRLLREQPNAGHCALELTPGRDFAKPDVLVYWAPGNPSLTNGVPADARLMGVMGSGPVFPIPEASSRQTGVLMLYSLADDEVLDVSKTLETPRN
jgi:hypothetical protein